MRFSTKQEAMEPNQDRAKGSTLQLVRVFGVFRGNPSFRWMPTAGFSIIAP
jgi:hypothetical protein